MDSAVPTYTASSEMSGHTVQNSATVTALAKTGGDDRLYGYVVTKMNKITDLKRRLREDTL